MTSGTVAVQIFEVIFMAKGYVPGIFGFNLQSLPVISGDNSRKA